MSAAPGLAELGLAAWADWPGLAPQADAAFAECAVVVCTYRRPEPLRRFLASLALQRPRVAELVVVDASPDDATERVLRAAVNPAPPAARVRYLRVGAERRGVTRQRNLGLDLIESPLVGFFDDDIVLLPGCLDALLEAHRERGSALAGAGACIANDPATPPARWRARRMLGVVSSLAPGRYFGSGVSTPWWNLPADAGPVRGDWLPGGASMWRADVMRAARLDERLGGYGCANDLEFSLRVAPHGAQLLVPSARVLHLPAPGGRPDLTRLGYEAMRNWWLIQRRFGGRRPGVNRLWYRWAVCAETALTAVSLLRPGHARDTWAELRGVLRFGGERFLGGA